MMTTLIALPLLMQLRRRPTRCPQRDHPAALPMKTIFLIFSHPCSDEGFIEPPSKKAKTSTSKPDPAASEASTPATAPVVQISTASSLSKGKEIPSTAAAMTSPPEKPDLRSVISSLEASASQYTSLETDKARLQKEVESSSSKLEDAIKIVAKTRQKADSLKDELEELKRKLKDEETSRLAA
ncbi:hypothetical protein QYE76_066135 [Lolium multiflorum]|uniref:Uncharacterized protein n=1 Tax=Lolium multiflorum TaxID=4521 RepID=A0AAD8SCA8_LOLMU|nr:hypothetical protein QYE76_066135 [Lolium multiflorum]